MKNAILTILISVFLPTTAYSQKVISGNVTDANHKGVPHANVVLLSADSSFVNGSETDANGGFRIEDHKNNGKIIRVTCLGHETVTLNTDNRSKYHIKLHEKPEMLDEVVVKSPETPYRLDGNKLVTTVKGTPLAKLGTLNRVLEFVPGIIPSGNGVTVFGKGSPTFYINGKKVHNTAEIRRIDVKDIKAIELIKNPGAQYSGTDRAVINIKTARKPGEGLSIFNVNWLQAAHNWSADEMLNMNYRSGRFDLFGMLYLTRSYGYQDSESSYSIHSETPLKLNNRYKTFSPTKMAEGYVGFDYYLTKSNSFGLRYTHRHTDTDGRMDYNTEAFSNGAVTDRQRYNSSYSIPRDMDRVGAYYDGWIKRLVKINFNAEFYSGRDRNNTQTTERSEQNGGRTVTTRNRSHNNIFASDLSLTYPWKDKHRLKGGVEYYHTHRNFSFVNEEGLLDNVFSKTDQNIFSAYINYSLRLKMLRMNFGLRYEHYKFNVYDNGVLSEEQSKTYNDIYPDISVSYPFGKLQTSLSYSIKTAKPSYSSLNSNTQYDSRNIYNSGNPFLQPTKIHNLELMLQYGIATLTLDYIHQKDMIVRGFSFYDKQEPIVLKSYRNVPSTDIFQAFLTLQKKIGIWQPTLSAGIVADNFKMPYDETKKKLNNPYATFKFDNTFSLPRNWNIYLLTLFTTEGDDNIYRQGSNNRVSVSVLKSWKNMEIDVLFNDIFKSFKPERTIHSDICTDWTRSYIDTFNVQISLRIRLNDFYSKYKGRNVAEKEAARTR